MGHVLISAIAMQCSHCSAVQYYGLDFVFLVFDLWPMPETAGTGVQVAIAGAVVPFC